MGFPIGRASSRQLDSGISTLMQETCSKNALCAGFKEKGREMKS